MPSPADQLDELIVWIGVNQASQAESVPTRGFELDAWIGARIVRDHPNAGLGWLLREDKTKEFIEQSNLPQSVLGLRLRMAGWERYRNLTQRRIDSRRAFMAMKFNEEMDKVYQGCFRPAVERAGFELLDLRDQQRAGIIDDQMRVAIRSSCFVIADLTHNSRGAYWEAGFAEGLGREVIYTCKAQTWAAEKTHFDTNHLATVIWDVEDLQSASNQLTLIIRNSLPDEAKMTDDVGLFRNKAER